MASAWKARSNTEKPALPLSAYTGTYTNNLNGNINIIQSGAGLKISFSNKPDLNATLDYIGNNEWLLQYNNIEYGIFAITFELAGNKVKSITTRQNEFVEYDPYTYIKK